MKRVPHIPTIFAIFILVLGVGMGVFLVSREQNYRLGAAPETAPYDVKISNVTNTSFSVSWVTDKAVTGAVNWGETAAVGTIRASNDVSRTHFFTITGISPGRTYFFKINSGGKLYDDSGAPWTAQTATTASSQSHVLTGSVLTDTGTPAYPVLVYVSAPNLALAAETSENGNWTITAPLAAGQAAPSEVEIFIQAGDNGIATAQTTFEGAKRTPPITLGKTYDFRSSAVNLDENSPESQLNLPEDTDTANGTGGFEVDETLTTTSQTNVTLESIEDEEKIFTDKPEFFGDGPGGTSITITVNSTPVTQVLTIPQTGTWRWSPPTNLEPGDHSVKVSWRDTNGILRTIERQFTVLAADSDEPAFESTPSATKTPSPTPIATKTPSPTPTASASATPKATASATPIATKTPSPTASGSALPNAGSVEQTMLLAILGIIMTASGVILYRKS